MSANEDVPSGQILTIKCRHLVTLLGYFLGAVVWTMMSLVLHGRRQFYKAISVVDAARAPKCRRIDLPAFKWTTAVNPRIRASNRAMLWWRVPYPANTKTWKTERRKKGELDRAELLLFPLNISCQVSCTETCALQSRSCVHRHRSLHRWQRGHKRRQSSVTRTHREVARHKQRVLRTSEMYRQCRFLRWC